MRVVSGRFKGRNLKAVPDEGTRPILDRVKTALFDKIRSEIQEASVLDLFAGSGSVGIEALSQGANSCVFTEINKKAIEVIKDNVESLGIKSETEILHQDAFAYLKKTKKSFDLVYVAPPQYKSLWIEALHYIAERPEVVSRTGQIIVQIDPKEYEKVELHDFSEVEERKYGSTLLVFYRKCTKE